MVKGFTHEAPSEGDTNEWYTPPHIFEALGVEFDLDPCAPIEESKRTVPAKRYLTANDDGLFSPWGSEENVFVNPPYGPHTAVWVSKLGLHGKGIALVFARTDTKWFQDIGFLADAICFIRGRVQFIQEDGTLGSGSSAGSCLIAWGEENVKALKASRLGAVVNATR